MQCSYGRTATTASYQPPLYCLRSGYSYDVSGDSTATRWVLILATFSSLSCISSILLYRYNGILLYGLDNVAAGFPKATKIPETFP